MVRHSDKNVCAPLPPFFNVGFFSSVGMRGNIEERGAWGVWDP